MIITTKITGRSGRSCVGSLIHMHVQRKRKCDNHSFSIGPACFIAQPSPASFFPVVRRKNTNRNDANREQRACSEAASCRKRRRGRKEGTYFTLRRRIFPNLHNFNFSGSAETVHVFLACVCTCISNVHM